MTLHLKSRGYPFRPRLLFSGFIAVGVGSPTVYYFRRGQNQKYPRDYLGNSSGAIETSSFLSYVSSEEWPYGGGYVG